MSTGNVHIRLPEHDLSLTCSNVVNCGQVLAKFQMRHGAWLERMCDADGIVMSLPYKALSQSLRLFHLDPAELEAEWEFSQICQSLGAIGFCASTPLKYTWLSGNAPWPTCQELKAIPGMTEKGVLGVLASASKMAGIERRIGALLGRMVSNAGFLKNVSEIMALRDSIGQRDRPRLPLWRPADVSRSLGTAPLPRELSAAEAHFWTRFAALCEESQIRGLATFDLPIPPELNWSDTGPLGEPRDDGVVQTTTPNLFPLLKSDNLGDQAIAEHERQAIARGVDDHKSWKTYELFLPISHWDRVLGRRYPDAKVKGFSTSADYVIAPLLGVGVDRLQTLRKRMKARQAGTLSSLRGRR